MQLVLFDWSNNTCAIDVKMDGFVLEEKSSSSWSWRKFLMGVCYVPLIISNKNLCKMFSSNS